MPKPPSARASARGKDVPLEAIEALADQLAGKPYGDKAPVQITTQAPAANAVIEAPAKPVDEKAKSLTISLPPSMIRRVEDAAIEAKRTGGTLKSVSAIIRDALIAKGF